MRVARLTTLLLALLLGACYRSHEGEPSVYTITNQLPVAVTLDLYPSAEDYYRQSNREARHELAPQATLTLSLASFKTYGIDWYSKDYCYTNWTDPRQHPIFTLHASPLPLLQTHGMAMQLPLTVDQPDSSRPILLGGHGRSSTWKAVNPDPTPHQGIHLFELRNDFRCRYTVIDSAGSRSYDYPYYLMRAISPYFSVLIQDSSDQFEAQLGYSNIPGTWTHRDTLTLRFKDSPPRHFYPAVRQ